MEEAVIKRIMPHSLEAEQSVIGSMIMDRDAILTASDMLVKDDFYHQQYGILFETITELFNGGDAVDIVTLQNRLREKNVPPEISSLEYVGELVNAVPTSANVKYYAQIVQEKAVMRRLIKTNEEIANTCYLGNESLDVILEDTEKKIFQLLQTRMTSDYVPIKDVVLKALERIEQASRTQGTVTGIPTGFSDLDYKLSGLQPSDLILVAARPSMGKTALVLNIAQYVAFHEDMATAIFSLEMSKEQLVNRLFSLESRVDAQLLRSGNLSDADWEKLIEGAGIIGKSHLIIDDTPGISISELRSKCRKYKLEHDLKLVIIDYLQLMTGSGRSDSRQQEISDISRSLKQVARELNVPVIALSQLSRQVEQRPDHRPMLSDLRESGAIEQDADVVMFIYRDDYYNKDSDNKGIAEIIIAKQRNGPHRDGQPGMAAPVYEVCKFREIKAGGSSMQIHQSAEDYLECILKLSKVRPVVRSIDIANEMNFSKPSISVAMKNLRTNGYIRVDESGFITLTESGMEIASSIYERHLLLKKWLVFLGVEEQVAEADACKIEHTLSPQTFAALKAHIYENMQDRSDENA